MAALRHPSQKRRRARSADGSRRAAWPARAAGHHLTRATSCRSGRSGSAAPLSARCLCEEGTRHPRG
eukprot:13937095-Alexandrium_andersonii.AAC.1